MHYTEEVWYELCVKFEIQKFDQRRKHCYCLWPVMRSSEAPQQKLCAVACFINMLLCCNAV